MNTNSVFVMILSMILSGLTTSPPLTIAKTANKKPNRLSLKLLHRSSIPLFENENFQDFLENNKHGYLRNSKFSTSVGLFEATEAHLYFVNLSIGDPPVPQYLAIDTGSSLVWVSKSINKKFLYQPTSSATYKDVSCSSRECSWSGRFSCSTKDACYYQLHFADTRYVSIGYLGFERFMFTNEALSGGYEKYYDTLDNVLFGVSPVTKGELFTDPNFNGILGLGPQRTSIMRSILPPKLSYCISDIYDTASQVNFLNIGDVDNWNVLNSSMFARLYHKEYYRTDMECINFNETCLPIEPATFKYHGNDPFTGVVFDSGTVYTFLPDVAYDQLTEQVDKFMKSRGFVEVEDKDIEICYDGQREDISDFPPLSFHFGDNNADLSLRLETGSLFYNVHPRKFCISMLKSSSKNSHMKNFTIIGLAAQQKHTMLFDLEQSRMSILYSSCEY